MVCAESGEKVHVCASTTSLCMLHTIVILLNALGALHLAKGGVFFFLQHKV